MRWRQAARCSECIWEDFVLSHDNITAHAHRTPLLRVEGLNAWYGQAHILFDIDLSVAPGEVVALTGPNGAGKSTTLKAIMGLVARRSGSVQFEGREISGWPPYRIARAGLGYVPEDRRVFTDLTVNENLATGRR